MTEQNKPQSTSFRILLAFAAFVIVIAGVKTASSLIIPFLLSIFIAIICEPPIFWMQKKGIPFGVALIVIILTIISIGGMLTGLVGSSIDEFTASIPVYEQRLGAYSQSVLNWLDEKGLGLAKQQITDVFNPAAALKLVGIFANSISGLLTNTFLILITVIFILVEAAHLPEKLKFIMSDPDNSMQRLKQIGNNINRYLGIKTLTSLLTGLLVTGGLLYLGVDFAVLWGVLAFCLNFVPNIGSIIAAVPAILLALIQLGPVPAMWTGLIYLIVNNLVGNFVEPKFMGKGLGLSPLVVFLSLIFWGWVLGPVGMFLSVPLTMTAKIALEGNPDSRWIAVLLANDAPGHHDDTRIVDKDNNPIA